MVVRRVSAEKGFQQRWVSTEIGFSRDRVSAD
jgi:hypothetical protein